MFVLVHCVLQKAYVELTLNSAIQGLSIGFFSCKQSVGNKIRFFTCKISNFIPFFITFLKKEYRVMTI